jgi:hypothetical protein
MRTLLARATLTLALAFLSSCSGVFQRSLPDRVDAYAVDVAVAPDGELRVGSAERDVTPAVGSYLAGFDMARTSTAVSSPLKVRALVIATARRSFAIVGIDNLGVMREDVDWIKAGLHGFANGDVFVCASHTHAGPDLIGLWGWYFMSSGRDRDYLVALRRATAEAVEAAVAAAAPATFVLGDALLPPRGLVKNANRAGVFDRRVTVLHARAVADGKPLGTLLHLSCHPEVMPRRNTAISADFVGDLCDEWRVRGHGQAVFSNGELGAMISPDVKERDAVGVRAFGVQACDICERALASARPLAVDAIEVRRRDVYLPMIAAGFRIGRLTTVLQRELFDGYARSTVGYLRIGAFEAIAVPGEMEPALAARLRASLHRPELVVFGLCDDEVGYLLRDQEAHDPEFAYERSMSPCRSAGELVAAAITGPVDRATAADR